jgi:hypothetical protein
MVGSLSGEFSVLFAFLTHHKNYAPQKFYAMRCDVHHRYSVRKTPSANQPDGPKPDSKIRVYLEQRLFIATKPPSRDATETARRV